MFNKTLSKISSNGGFGYLIFPLRTKSGGHNNLKKKKFIYLFILL